MFGVQSYNVLTTVSICLDCKLSSKMKEFEQFKAEMIIKQEQINDKHSKEILELKALFNEFISKTDNNSQNIICTTAQEKSKGVENTETQPKSKTKKVNKNKNIKIHL